MIVVIMAARTRSSWLYIHKKTVPTTLTLLGTQLRPQRLGSGMKFGRNREHHDPTPTCNSYKPGAANTGRNKTSAQTG